ncbi:MAG: hypothetical protein ACLQBB_06070 [Solirubrobacteraceae bacterium]
MSDAGNVAKSLRERLGGPTEDRLGRALSELLENPLLTGAIGRAFDAREKAAQAQEVAMGALNLPSAADIERLTRRLRAVSHRLEGIEDGVDRLDRALTPTGVEARLAAIEAQLRTLTEKVDRAAKRTAPQKASRPAGATRAAKASSTVKTDKAVKSVKSAKAAKASRPTGSAAARPRAPRPGPGRA